MAESTKGFVKRIGREVSDFANQKSRELAEGVQKTADRVTTEAEERTYRVALTVVANHFRLTREEAEQRLATPHTPVIRTRRTIRSLRSR